MVWFCTHTQHWQLPAVTDGVPAVWCPVAVPTGIKCQAVRIEHWDKVGLSFIMDSPSPFLQSIKSDSFNISQREGPFWNWMDGERQHTHPHAYTHSQQHSPLSRGLEFILSTEAFLLCKWKVLTQGSDCGASCDLCLMTIEVPLVPPSPLRVQYHNRPWSRVP